MSPVVARQRTFTKAPDPAPRVNVHPAAQAVQATPARLTAPKGMRMQATPYVARFADAARLVARAGAELQPAQPFEKGKSDDGKRPYTTLDGKQVELPADLTAEEATQLERDGSVAEKRLGKGPLPRSVPDAKNLAKKGEKRDKTAPQGRGKRGDGGRGKAFAKPAAAAAMLLESVGRGAVARYLAAQGAPILARGIGRLGKLRDNEQTHDDAAEKLNQSEKAVLIPASEGQAKGNTHQVDTVESRPAPVADQSKAKQRLTESLAENIPRSIEDVDNFKRDQKAQHIGAEVMKVVQGDSNTVTSTFGDVTQTPPPAPSEHVPVGLPPTEMAPPTGAMNLGQGAVAPLQKEHTDVSNFTKEADNKLKEEGVTQEQLDMVDSGDLAEANKEKKGLETKAKTEPLAVQKFALQEATAIDDGLQKEEKAERERLSAQRRGALGATTEKQKGTTSALEKKRDEVAAKINGIYKLAQGNVKKKLADLETESLKRFDSGNERATKAFEENVHRELEAYKADRYSGWFGWARKAKDWLLGMDGLPRVKAIFDTHRKAFVDTINRLVEAITADQKRVIAECKQELADAKRAIKDYVDKLGPDLRNIGKKTASEMADKLAALDNFISEKEQELAAKLKDKQTAAIKAIDDKVAKMKEAMSGALAKLGKLLLLAAKKFFSWALEKAGVSLATIEGIINKGTAVLKAIFTHPIQFVKHLINAAGTGFKNFGKNFLTHLKDAVFAWLTGALEGVALPASWTFQGIVSVIFQLVGLTYQQIRARLVRVIPEPAVKALETTFTLVKTLVTEGPMAAWEQLKEIAGEMKDTFIEAVKDWIKTSIVQKAIETVLSMLIPGAGIIRAVIGIYDTIVFFIQKAKDIIQMVGYFLGSIADIAAGNIGAAAAALEAGLARGLKLVIEFLARFLRLSGITNKIREIIQKIRAKVEAVIDKVVAWIVAQAKRLGKFVAQAGVPQDSNERLRLGLTVAVSAVNRFAGQRVRRVALEPALAAIRMRYGFTQLVLIPVAGKWAIKAVINPERIMNSDAESEGGPSEASTTRIQQLLGVQNRGGYLIEIDPGVFFGATIRRTLERISPMLVDRDVAVRREAIDALRLKDKQWKVLQGMIYAPFIQQQQRAVGELATASKPAEVLYSLDRGGSLLAAEIAQRTGARVVAMPKIRIEKRTVLASGRVRTQLVSSKSLQVDSLRHRIVNDLASAPNAASEITLAETVVGGGSAAALVNMAKELIASNQFPSITFKILLLQQTMQTDRARGVVEHVQGSVARADRVKVVVASTSYILGEDVSYQSARKHAESNAPVIVFKATEERMFAYQIVPVGTTKARDIIIDLVSGKYDNRLPNVL